MLFFVGLCSMGLVATFSTSIPMIHKLQERQGQDPGFPRLTRFVRTHRLVMLLGGAVLFAIAVGILLAIGPANP